MVGAVIAGKYRIESLIGSGGMANVYKAYDEQEGRTVAIKMLKAEHREDTEFLRRFEREAKAVITPVSYTHLDVYKRQQVRSS